MYRDLFFFNIKLTNSMFNEKNDNNKLYTVDANHSKLITALNIKKNWYYYKIYINKLVLS